LRTVRSPLSLSAAYPEVAGPSSCWATGHLAVMIACQRFEPQHLKVSGNLHFGTESFREMNSIFVGRSAYCSIIPALKNLSALINRTHHLKACRFHQSQDSNENEGSSMFCQSVLQSPALQSRIFFPTECELLAH